MFDPKLMIDFENLSLCAEELLDLKARSL